MQTAWVKVNCSEEEDPCLYGTISGAFNNPIEAILLIQGQAAVPLDGV